MFENYPYIKRNLIIAGIAITLCLVGMFIYVANSSMLFTPHGSLIIKSVPDSLTMSYNNTVRTVHANSTTITIPTGKYTISFTADGFGAHSESMSIEDGKTYTVWFLLTPYSDAAKAEYANTKYASIKEGIAGYNSYKSSEQLVPKYPILKYLPINTLTYSIELCPPYASTDGRVAKIGVCITVTDSNDKDQVAAAVNELTSRSLNLSDYIIYVNNTQYQASGS